MTTPPINTNEAKNKVRAQYGAVGDAYVKSVGHATGNDLQRMVELSAPQPTERLLDIGTGGGHVARVFAPHVAEVVATDLTPEILTHAAASFADHGLANISTAIADAEDLPFADASFQLVTCRIAPHHFPNPAAFVNEVARVLAPGGRFVLIDSTVPEGAAGEFLNQFEALRDPSHVRSLQVTEWKALIAASGLHLQQAESFAKRHDIDDWTTRSGMSAEDRQTLESMMVGASLAMQEQFQAEISNGRLRAFSDTKTLFLATRPK